MDIGNLGIVSTLSAGREIEFTHPVTGEAIGVFVTIMGNDSPDVRAARRDVMRKAMAGDKKPDDDAASEVLLRSMAARAVIGVRGATGDTETVEQMREFLVSHPDGIFFVNQIMESWGTKSFFTSAETA